MKIYICIFIVSIMILGALRQDVLAETGKPVIQSAMYQQGVEDALIYYDTKLAFGTTMCVTSLCCYGGIATGLIMGLVPHRVERNAPYHSENLSNAEYVYGYNRTANREKWKAVGKGVAIGGAINLAIYLFILSALIPESGLN